MFSQHLDHLTAPEQLVQKPLRFSLLAEAEVEVEASEAEEELEGLFIMPQWQ
jgi:hypothetical protein